MIPSSISEIKKEFPNYKDDILFGGDYHLVKTIITDTEIIIKYILELENIYYICEDSKYKFLYKNCDYDFFDEIIKDNTISNGCIYKLNGLINNLSKHYKKIYTLIDVSDYPKDVKVIKNPDIEKLIESISTRINYSNQIYDVMKRTMIPNILFSNCVIKNYEGFSGCYIHCYYHNIDTVLAIDDDYVHHYDYWCGKDHLTNKCDESTSGCIRPRANGNKKTKKQFYALIDKCKYGDYLQKYMKKYKYNLFDLTGEIENDALDIRCPFSWYKTIDYNTGRLTHKSKRDV